VNGIIALGIVVAFALVALVVGIRYTRRNEPTPRRHEFNKLRSNYGAAVGTLNEIENVLDRYRPSLDDVGLALIVDVRAKIKEYDRMRLENEK
jgi:hypothetical protein